MADETEWTRKDIQTVLYSKLKNKYWSWDMIASTIDYRQTPEACRLLFEKRHPTLATKRRYELKRIREDSPPWSLAQRRRMAKLRAMDPPVDWKKIAKDISNTEHDYHPPESCKEYYENIMTERQKERGRHDAKAKDRDPNYLRGLMRSYGSKRWMPEEEELLIELCTDRVMPWSEIAMKLRRSVTSVQSKWRRMEPSLRETLSNNKSKGKIIKNKNTKAIGIGKVKQKKKSKLSRSRSDSPGVGSSGTA